MAMERICIQNIFITSGYAASFLEHLQDALGINILAMEYPSYGIYKDKTDPSADQIEADADAVY